MTNPRHTERGQSLPLMVLFLPVLFGFVALGLDVARLYVERSAEQAAADLAALSGARMLPGSASGAQNQALSIATANGYTTGGTTTVTATSPYSGDSTKIEVTITRSVSLYFMPVLGVNTMNVSARSVARHQPASAGPNPPPGIAYGIYAGATSCAGGASSEGVHWTGSNASIKGLVHSESGIKVTGGNNTWTGATTYRCQGSFTESGNSNTYSPAPAQSSTSVPWPVSYAWSDFCSTGGTYYHATGKFDLAANGPWWVGGSKASKQLNPGVYCADGTNAEIVLSTGQVSGNVTLVSKGVISITGADFGVTSYMNGVAMAAYGSGSSTLKYSGSNTVASGILYAPSGEVEFTGPSGGVFTGALIGMHVNVTGGNFQIVAQDQTPGSTPVPTPEILQLTE